MVQDPGAAQARALLNEMYQQVENIARRLETVERGGRRTSIRGAIHERRQLAALRHELDEAHYLIDGLQRRFLQPQYTEHPAPRSHAIDERRYG